MSATLTTLVSFDGDEPVGDLIADANGDLFGRPRTAALTATGQCSKWRIRETSTSRSTTKAFFNGRDTSRTLLAF
jgi:hypothetical protein